MRKPIGIVIAFSLVVSALGAGAQSPVKAESSSSAVAVKYASGFSIEKKDGYTLLRVSNPWPGAKSGFAYALYPRGAKKPSGVKADAFFETPVRKVVSFSTSYIPAIAAVGEAGSIVGVDSAAYLSTPEARARVASGAIVEVSKDWTPNIELLISLAPDAVFTYGMGNEWDAHPKMAEAGLPIVISGEWNESDPLGRAEWIKFIAAFYGKEAEASAYFDRVAADYEKLRSRIAPISFAPNVLVNGPFQGTWSVSGGGSYMARLIADAGGLYLWSEDKSTGGLTLSVEAVYERALKAMIWLNPGAGISSVKDIKALDPRFASLPAVKNMAVWNNTLKLNDQGGNEYYEGAVIRPDLVLADLVMIMHPGILKDVPFSYFRRISE